MTLSSTEAEYVALSDTCKEMLFIRSTLNFMGMNIIAPIEVKVDNMGALFLAQNGCGKRTRHIDTRHHFVYDYVENDQIKVVFVQTLENKSDPFTKNTNGDIYKRHTGCFMYKGECSPES